ncbi:MAG: polymer-forming cytoskeletal protein [Anaerolineae bacterium]|nr:polymer-forming cytoskeletal protein [Anaerolineae bacterium]
MPQPAVGNAVRSQSTIESVIGPNTHFRGDLQGDGGLRIEGVMEGTVDITGNLVVSESARVFAEIKANNISIAGAVKGNISASRVEILDTGRVWGDLTIKSLLINEGAYLRGQTYMPQDIQPPQLEAPAQEALTSSEGPKAGTVVDVEPEDLDEEE